MIDEISFLLDGRVVLPMVVGGGSFSAFEWATNRLHSILCSKVVAYFFAFCCHGV